jgi:DNA-3-methyladenine glycosylase
MVSMKKNTQAMSKKISRNSASKGKVLTQKFFERETEIVARELLGKFLVRSVGKTVIASMITETEAYDGFEDLASHARFGPTKRNAPMFGHGGYWYVYLCYGVHWLLNITTREHGYPAAVLIRGVADADGPGKLTKHLRIDGGLSGKKADRSSALWIEDRGVEIALSKIEIGPRVGVDYAGEWKEKHLRFRIHNTM